jgi:serine/threonine protein kinase
MEISRVYVVVPKCLTVVFTPHQMNILVDVVDDIPHARIADFGIAIVTKNVDSIRPDTRQEVHTPRWSAPEIYLGQNPSKESDVYSFAMVVIEVH